MQPDVVCFYADIGKPEYIPLIRRMCQSAKAVMPDCRTVLLTPNLDPQLRECFDIRAHLDTEVTPNNLCESRALATVTWQLQSDRVCLYADPDIVFQRVPEIDPAADVLLSWRPKYPAMPVNSGLVIAKPGSPEFWKKYGSIAVNLPDALRSWWCDQLAYSLLIGVDHGPSELVRSFDANVKLIDSRVMCAKLEDGTEDSWSLHYKGKRKWTKPNLEKSGAGNPLAVCA